MYPKYFPLTLAVLLSFCLLLQACDTRSKNNQSVERAAGQIGDQIKEQTSKIGDLFPSRQDIQKSSEEQIEKTFAIEYRVVDVGADLPAPELERTMTKLGNERWDCFATVTRPDALRLICKRRPMSALRVLVGAGGLLF